MMTRQLKHTCLCTAKSLLLLLLTVSFLISNGPVRSLLQAVQFGEISFHKKNRQVTAAEKTGNCELRELETDEDTELEQEEEHFDSFGLPGIHRTELSGGGRIHQYRKYAVKRKLPLYILLHNWKEHLTES